MDVTKGPERDAPNPAFGGAICEDIGVSCVDDKLEGKEAELIGGVATGGAGYVEIEGKNDQTAGCCLVYIVHS